MGYVLESKIWENYMAYNNTVAIISNSEFTVQEIKGMLVLLRDIDNVECFEYFDAEEEIKKSLPSVIILHANENDKNCIKLLKKIRQEETTKKIPVILYAEYSNTDFIIEAFDNGVSDILTQPLKDYELIIRVIWAIQRSEIENMNKIKDLFLCKLGITDENTGFYKEEFSLKFLETVVNQAKENKQKSCLLMIKANSTIEKEVDKELLMKTLKNTIRMNDTIATKDENSYYIFLSKSKLNGVYSVYERLASRLAPMIATSASAVEIQDEIFDDIINVLDFAISKNETNDEITIVQKQDFLDMYQNDENEELGIAQLLDDNRDEEAEVTTDEIYEEIAAYEEEEITEDETVNLGLKIMQEKVEEIQQQEDPKEALIRKKEKEMQEIDERNAILYKQSYAKKLTMVVEPLLKKYAGKFQNEYKLLDANINVSPYETFMRFDKDDIKLNFEMTYDGLKTIHFNLSISALGTPIESDSVEIEVMEFDRAKLDIILKTITEEYKNYLEN